MHQSFAHRVTLMSRDFVLVSRLRYRFDKFLEPIPMADRKAFDILNIPELLGSLSKMSKLRMLLIHIRQGKPMRCSKRYRGSMSKSK